ncbi:nuclear transport factor 2 family protein [Glycomyces buryatensis]|uniref:SnoaL-like polyketide cyclase n=1 Tax=Glycomyces buryatensis TaxID=2570927 RepID=A0A4S8QCN7_9ACTN|nr:nuclear transport factor 2 family protein [Glycomyces buryatensis]THV42128.1 SnoaL-like polyketide cyclase [Glycomyces buryatensis]
MKLKKRARRLLVATAAATALAATSLAAISAASAFPASDDAAGATAASAEHGGAYQEAYQKYVAVEVLEGVFERGDTDVVDRYVWDDYIQHNPVATDGAETLKNLGVELAEQFPDAEYDVQRVLSEDDLVVVHSNVKMTPDTLGMAVVDIFRFDGQRIREHWDSGQNVPEEDSVSGNDMFSQVTPVKWWPSPEAEESSREVVTAYVEGLSEQDVTVVDEFVADDYVQHNPNFPNGAEELKSGLADFFEQNPESSYDVKRVITDGEFVAVHAHLKNNPDDLGMAVVDLYLVRDGQIREHWDTLQPVPAESANDNTMF